MKPLVMLSRALARLYAPRVRRPAPGTPATPSVRDNPAAGYFGPSGPHFRRSKAGETECRLHPRETLVACRRCYAPTCPVCRAERAAVRDDVPRCRHCQWTA